MKTHTSSQGRKLSFALTATLGASAVVLVVLEGALRLAGADLPPPPLFPGDRVTVADEREDVDIGWKLPPNRVIEAKSADFSVSYRSNALGFRGTEHEIESGSRGVAFLGDSYTFGHGVSDDETFPSVLAERLNLSQCCNLAMPAFSLGQMWLTLRKYGLPLRPSAVVVSFIFDDFYREGAYHELGRWFRRPVFRLENGAPVPMTETNRPGAVYRLIAQQTKLYAASIRLENALLKRITIGPTWALNRAIFAAMRDDCRAAGIPFLVVYLPQKGLPQTLPWMAAEFANLDIDFIDLSRQLPPAPRHLYFREDLHMNAAGNRYVADKLEPTLEAILDR
jgi:hypothetical protein